MRGIFRAAFAACVLVLAAPLAQAQSQGSLLDEIVARGVLRVGLTGDYRPFSIVDPKAPGGMQGLDVDMANSLAKSLGVKLEIVQTAWPKLMADLAEHKYDIGMGGITITLPRQKAAFFSIPVMSAGKTAIARCDDKQKFQSLAEIDKPDVKVIVNPGGTNETFDRASLHSAQIVVFPDNAKIFDEVAAGHADVMITDGVEARLQQKLHPQLCAIHPDQPFNHSELGYLLPRDVAWQQYVDQWLHLADLTGEHQKLVAKWLE